MPLPAIIPLALDLIQTGVGAANKSAAAAEAERLRKTRPAYEISPESYDELNLAESELQGGIGSRAARAYTQQADKNISSSLSAILKGGGNLNNIGDLYGAADEGNLRLAQIQDQLRLNQISNTVNARRNMTDQRDKSLMYNQDQWWKNDAAANANAKAGADEQMWNGINGFGGNLMTTWNNALEKSEMNKYLNQNSSANPISNRTDYTPEVLRPSDYRVNSPQIRPMNPTFNPNFNPMNSEDYYQYSNNNNFNDFG